MLVVAIVGYIDQAFVKPTLVCATLVAAYQKDGMPLGIECKRHPPDWAVPGKAQLLHVGVPRTLQCIHCRTAEIRAKFRQQSRVRQQFVLQILLQGAEFRVKGIVKENSPSHERIMVLITYVVKVMIVRGLVAVINIWDDALYDPWPHPDYRAFSAALAALRGVCACVGRRHAKLGYALC